LLLSTVGIFLLMILLLWGKIFEYKFSKMLQRVIVSEEEEEEEEEEEIDELETDEMNEVEEELDYVNVDDEENHYVDF